MQAIAAKNATNSLFEIHYNRNVLVIETFVSNNLSDN